MRTLNTILESTRLHEAEKASELLSDKDIGLLLVDESSHRLFMLFSLSRFEQQLEIARTNDKKRQEMRKAWGDAEQDRSGFADSEEVYEEMYDLAPLFGLSVMDASKDLEDSGPCWGASTVFVTAAEKGYGPAIYEIGLASMGSLIPDRRSVSLGASNVWKKFLRRSDIEAKPLDNKHQPVTPSPMDDCKVFFRTPEDRTEVDYAYQLTAESKQKILSSIIPTLKRRAEETLKRLGFMINETNAEKLIYSFFRPKYYGSNWLQS